MAIAKKHHRVVLEDASQAPLAEVNHKKVGTIGDAGCFSFQNSKNIAVGEGGTIVSDNDAFIDRCFSYRNLGFPHGSMVGSVSNSSMIQATKVRFTENQAAIGLAQLQRLEAQTTTRNENAAYLKKKIRSLPGIIPYKLYGNVTRAALHVFAFRYKRENFKDLPREKFLKASQAEGVPCANGYEIINTQPFLDNAFQSRAVLSPPRGIPGSVPQALVMISKGPHRR
jgi:dTDP-4-amino-4,6-dideoxygalactose transaminase